jgi:hypothetical protein
MTYPAVVPAKPLRPAARIPCNYQRAQMNQRPLVGGRLAALNDCFWIRLKSGGFALTLSVVRRDLVRIAARHIVTHAAASKPAATHRLLPRKHTPGAQKTFMEYSNVR